MHALLVPTCICLPVALRSHTSDPPPTHIPYQPKPNNKQVAFRRYVSALVSASLVDEEASSIAELGDFLEMDPDYVHATLKAQVCVWACCCCW